MGACQQQAPILSNHRLQGEYHRLVAQADRIAAATQPGQFVHLQLPDFAHRVLRRPFSICDVDPDAGTLTIVYKTVGEGTQRLSTLQPGTPLDLMGPLGHGYTLPSAGIHPIVVAGGYGCAATYLFARRAQAPCTVLLGGRSAADILLEREFRDLGCDVRIATDKGDAGHHGLVTDLLGPALSESPRTAVVACGPNPMLHAVSRIVLARGLDAEVSLDHVMCCGVGACFACVVKLKAPTPDGWEYVRTCKAGPVFLASQVHWDDV